ncbi:uncharacterized protein LOC129722390 [Wyeomyia smithii]|uniref:uncharacterized protein LOC129722390 n=1 Tax=Wyeomyia smithii TaxID=174621 RepID=UPI0024680EC1|nr:uncharacterized protein LOC129722390 [Wyeomyia smithii]XP_055531769.1 uncharacterized protein LOC129722390 [Wyeomyia smithii]XP_055531770.1 uncharacterized protein LOC129722390 [Wyeomyia smithii]XP_055531771.1 uncharacterized protein LOC129722390 [Wyeomyia smithii]
MAERIDTGRHSLPEVIKRPGTTGSMQGYLYETKLFMSVLHHAIMAKVEPFHMASNVDKIGAFDDLVFLDDTKRGLFLQAKHSSSKDKRINDHALLREKGDFSLSKYVVSYQQIRNEFKNMEITCVLYTNSAEDLDGDRKQNVVKFSNDGYNLRERPVNVEDLLPTKPGGKKFQLAEAFYLYHTAESVAEQRIRCLAAKLIGLATSDNALSDNDIKRYRNILAEEVISVKTKKIKPDFFKKQKKLWRVLRESMQRKALFDIPPKLNQKEKIVLLESIAKKPTVENISKLILVEVEYNTDDERLEITNDISKWPNVSEERVQKIKSRFTTSHIPKGVIDCALDMAGRKRLESLSFKHFSATSEHDPGVSQEQHERLAINFIKAIQYAKNDKIPISQLLNGVHLDNINVIIGSLLSLDPKSQVYKLNPNSGKWKTLRERLPTRQAKIRFINNVSGFPLIIEEDKQIAKEFLEKFWFYVGQPKQNELENKLIRELHEEYSTSNKFEASNIMRNVHSEIQRWWLTPSTENDPCKGWLSNECKYFEEAKTKVNKAPTTAILDGLSRRDMVNSNMFVFSAEALRNLGLEGFSNGVRNIVTDQIPLTGLKLFQIFGKDSDYTFVKWNDVIAMKCMDKLLEELEDVKLSPIIVIDNVKDFCLNCSLFKKCILVSQKAVFSGSIVYDKLDGLSDLTGDSQRQVLAREKVFFQDVRVSLKSLILTPDLRKAIDSTTLSILLAKKEIKLGKTPAEDVQDYYVRRVLLRQTIVANFTSYPYFFLAKSSDFKSNELAIKSDIVTIDETDQVFRTLVKKFNDRNIHWLKNVGGYLLWQKSHGSMKKLRSVSVQVAEFHPETDRLDSVTLIAAEPGMGKSTLFSYLAKTIKQKTPTSWVANICLHDHSTVFQEWLNSGTAVTKETIKQFLFNTVRIHKHEKELKLTGPARLEKELFDHLYKERKIIIFLDGYDEISPNYEQQAFQLLDTLKSHNMSGVWISTRPNHQYKLEEQLGTFALKLKPFTEKDQKQFLQKFFKTNSTTCALKANQLDALCEEILSQFSRTIDDQRAEFVRIPLQLKMVAKVLTKWKDESSGTKNRAMNLIDLYDEFFRIKVVEVLNLEKEGLKDPNNSRASVNMMNQFETLLNVAKRNHQILAAFSLLDEQIREEFLSPQELLEGNSLLREIADSKEKTGIVYRIEYRQPFFVHQTFAEYFLVICLWEKLNAPEENASISSIVDKFMRNDKVQICHFLQQKAIKEITQTKVLLRICRIIICRSVLHPKRNAMKILIGIVDSFISSINLTECDKLLSSIFQDLRPDERELLFCVAVKMDYINLVEYFEHTIEGWNVNATYRDRNFTNYGDNELTALHIASREGFVQLVKHFAEKGAHIDAISSRGKSALIFASQYGRSETVRWLLKHTKFINIATSDKWTALHFAARNGDIEIITQLVKAGVNVDAVAPNNGTALMVAIDSGHIAAAEYLLTVTKNITAAETGDGYTALHYAANKGQTKIVQQLVDLGVDVDSATSSEYDDGETALHCAASGGHLGVLSQLIALGANPDITTESGETALMLSLTNGYPLAAKYLMTETLNLAAVDSSGNTALHLAASSGYLELVKQLITKGAMVDQRIARTKTAFKPPSYENLLKENLNIDAVDDEGQTALHLAAESGHTAIIKLLVAAKANVDASNASKRTALMLSSYEGHPDAVEYLITKTINVDAVDSYGQTALHLAASCGHFVVHDWCYNEEEYLAVAGSKKPAYSAVVKLLLTKNPNLEAADFDGLTALHLAVKSDHLQIVTQLIAAGARINARGGFEQTALHLAVKTGRVAILQRLLEAGADTNVTTDGYTALMLAIYWEKTEAANWLLTKTTNINAVGSDGKTTLYLAAEKGFIDIMQKLLKAGADVNANSCEGYTALMIALYFGHIDAAEWLLSKTATVNAVNSVGKTALYYAVKIGHIGIIQRLLEAGADVDTTLGEGFTVLMIAISLKHTEVATYLLSKTRNINAACGDGNTALHYAAKKGQIQIIQQLIQRGAKVDATNKDGDTALMVAIKLGHTDTAEYLRTCDQRSQRSSFNWILPSFFKSKR